MTPLARLRMVMRAMSRRGDMGRELDEELRLHVQLEMERNVAKGLGLAEARAAALRAFGNVEALK